MELKDKIIWFLGFLLAVFSLSAILLLFSESRQVVKGDAPNSGVFALLGVEIPNQTPIYLQNSAILEVIEAKAGYYGVNIKLALDLAEIESGFNPLAKNPNSSAKGIYQFIDSTWRDLCSGDVLDYLDNIDCAMKLLGKDIRNISHWTADKNTERKLRNKGWVF